MSNILTKPAHSVNVGQLERAASLIVGSALVLHGFRKRSFGPLALAALGCDLIYRGTTGYCKLYETLDVSTASDNPTKDRVSDDAAEVERAITIGKSPQELYDFWRNPQNLAKINAHFADVTPLEGDELTHWRVHSPIDRTIEWDSEVTEELPGQKLSWKSRPGTELPNDGSVQFQPAPGDRGTEVRVRFRFELPLGAAGKKLAKSLDFVPGAIAQESLRRFKSLVETGEIPTLSHNPSGRGSSDAV